MPKEDKVTNTLDRDKTTESDVNLDRIIDDLIRNPPKNETDKDAESVINLDKAIDYLIRNPLKSEVDQSKINRSMPSLYEIRNTLFLTLPKNTRDEIVRKNEDRKNA
jgi:hypothetical protein